MEQIGPIPDLFPVRVASQGLRPIFPVNMPGDHRTLLQWYTQTTITK
jgi:hypothetical protein